MRRLMAIRSCSSRRRLQLNVSLFDDLPFNLQRDIVPVSAIIDFPLVLLANPRCRQRPSRS